VTFDLVAFAKAAVATENVFERDIIRHIYIYIQVRKKLCLLPRST
jgi:hypothetical protein